MGTYDIYYSTYCTYIHVSEAIGTYGDLAISLFKFETTNALSLVTYPESTFLLKKQVGEGRGK